MIGNDIVDLQLASRQSNWRRRGWLQKICTDAEREAIGSAADPDTLVWIFWSMKEAVYKAHQRRFKLSRSFAPRALQCSHTAVQIDEYRYRTISNITKQHVHTIAVPLEEDTIKCQSQIFKGNHSQLLEELKTSIALQSNQKKEALKMYKETNGVPWFTIGDEKLPLSFSITHHGRFAAFVLSDVVDVAV